MKTLIQFIIKTYRRIVGDNQLHVGDIIGETLGYQFRVTCIHADGSYSAAPYYK